MPVLDNSRHEKFAQEIAKGTAIGEAYVLAGYDGENASAAAASASRLLKTAKIQHRVSELLNQGATRALVSVQKVLEKLEKAYDLAKKLDQPSAMVTAAMGQAKVAGIIIEKKEVGAPGDFKQVPDDRLEDFIISETKDLGYAGRATKH